MIKKIPNKSIYELFLDKIKKDIFVIPYCNHCKKNIWPPTDHCYNCLNKIILKNYTHKKGILIETFESYIDNRIKHNIINKNKKSKTNIDYNNSLESKNTVVGLVDFNGVLLLGKIINFKENSDNISKISYIQINKCGIDSNHKIFYNFSVLT
ncbi:MAG: hypothetical protein ACPKPY_07470 [Nitrososphaeraceae archaeon]